MMTTLILLVAYFVHFGNAGSLCPPKADMNPWFCINTPSSHQGTYTSVICNRPGCEKHLDRVDGVTDHLMLDRVVISDVNTSEPLMLPEEWLSVSRVRELEIRDTPLSRCFLCKNPLSGQGYYLKKLVVSSCSLNGYLCTNCPKLGKAVYRNDHYEKVYQVNGIDMIGLRGLKTLETLDLSFNKFEEVTNTSFPYGLINLKTLVLSHNIISEISTKTFTNFPALTTLDLSHNRLNLLKRDVFSVPDLTLKVLDVSWNRLSVLPEDTFSLMIGLREVNLANNLVQFLPLTTWNHALSAVNIIDVSGNFLICDCHIKWILTNLSSTTKLHGACSSPSKLADKLLKYAAGIAEC
ncbi:uncharacterized protein LOC143230617 [Tachypleus tridentatus]|uniref:uncharacterized protein LOC143230617 n=1 Tax=Tachypleus tridentatus TaxID=6853 RepID=UPI003FD2629A